MAKHNPAHLVHRYGCYHERLQAPGAWQLFKLAVEFRRDITVNNECARMAKAERQIAQTHRCYGQETHSQRAWVAATDALCELLGFDRLTEQYRDIYDLTGTVAAGNYRVPSPTEAMTEEELLQRFAEVTA
jgi:hypothetical protein